MAAEQLESLYNITIAFSVMISLCQRWSVSLSLCPPPPLPSRGKVKMAVCAEAEKEGIR